MVMEGLERFLRAQDAVVLGCSVYERARKEMREGRKRTHWIWYIFPQLEGLGRSRECRIYGIRGIEEARSYLAHEVLGARLREMAEILLGYGEGARAEVFMGSEIDRVKLRSSMTLFDMVSEGDVFGRVLERYYGG